MHHVPAYPAAYPAGVPHGRLDRFFPHRYAKPRARLRNQWIEGALKGPLSMSKNHTLDDLSYLAGLVDGEGHVGIHSRGLGRPGSKRFVIEIGMTSENVIDWLVENFGGSKRTLRKRKAAWKQQWRWRIQCGEAVELYKRLRPLLKIKNEIPVPTFHKPHRKMAVDEA